MWRLTPDALREGVKSTTRYRSKAPNKRAHRTHLPQPQRQASGAKGGQAARRSAYLKRSKLRPEPYVARSVPAAFDSGFGLAGYFGTDMWQGMGAIGEGMGLGARALDGQGMRVGEGPMAGLADAYVLAQGPEPLFTNSPTPEAEEPWTPVGDGWEGDVLGCGFDEVGGYQEYSG
jgi:hypothetical protein